MNVSCDVPEDQVGGVESHGSPKGGFGEQRRHFPFISQLAVTEKLPLGKQWLGSSNEVCLAGLPFLEQPWFKGRLSALNFAVVWCLRVTLARTLVYCKLCL